MLTAGKPGYSFAASGIQIDIYKCSEKTICQYVSKASKTFVSFSLEIKLFVVSHQRPSEIEILQKYL